MSIKYFFQAVSTMLATAVFFKVNFNTRYVSINNFDQAVGSEISLQNYLQLNLAVLKMTDYFKFNCCVFAVDGKRADYVNYYYYIIKKRFLTKLHLLF